MEQRLEEFFTFEDYMSWDEDVRCELIDGLLYNSIYPSPKHQRILMNLVTEIGIFLRGKKCRVYPAPFNVRIKGFTRRDTVLEPDLSVICDSSKVDDKGCKGAPDMIVEILSPSNRNHDRFTKFNLYRHAGVKEYWIVDPDDRTVEKNILRSGKYTVEKFSGTDVIDVYVLDGCKIDMNIMFEDID
jgi:Uma2 family endonuclease